MFDLNSDNRTKVIVHIVNPKIEYELFYDERNNAIKSISKIEVTTIHDLIFIRDDYNNTIFIPYSNIGLVEII